MKKSFPYIAGAVVLVLLLVMMIASRGKPVRRLDERITLRQQSKIPYGTAAARELLSSLFPNAVIESDNRYPGTWSNINVAEGRQAALLMGDYFDADEAELLQLSEFVKKGNDVFIIGRAFSDATANFFSLTFNRTYDYYNATGADSMFVKLESPPFAQDSFFTYPGTKYEGYVWKYDSSRTVVLGRNGNGYTNFISLKMGSGRFFIHTSPLAFSNFFVLHKNNSRYFQQAVSVLSPEVKKVVWNEYFLQKRRSGNSQKDTNWLRALMKYPAFRWGMLMGIFTLLLYVLLGMRRKQKAIPPYEKPQNESLDFVKTLGRLYYDKGDHKNLATKMGAYFLEHVRSVYKIATHTLDEDFIRLLHHKSGYPEEEIQKIVEQITQLPDWPNISAEKLALFHKRLELFYQNT